MKLSHSASKFGPVAMAMVLAARLHGAKIGWQGWLGVLLY